MTEYWQGVLDVLYWIGISIGIGFCFFMWWIDYSEAKRERKWAERQDEYWKKRKEAEGKEEGQ